MDSTLESGFFGSKIREIKNIKWIKICDVGEKWCIELE